MRLLPILQLLIQPCACRSGYKERLPLSGPFSELLFWRGQEKADGNVEALEKVQRFGDISGIQG